jgi:RES domain-containing protein
MRIYRITKAAYRDSVLSGHGASTQEGARWNRMGVPAVYAAQNASLALLEVLVHITDPKVVAAAGLAWFVFDVPDAQIATVEPAELPAQWRNIPYGKATQSIGTRFLQQGELAALIVPSAVVPAEFNLLLNPLHPTIRNLVPVEEIAVGWDSRLLAR